LPAKPEFAPEPAKATVSIFDLLNAVNAILKRLNQREDLREIFEDKWTVSEKIEQIVGALRERTRLKFSELFAGAGSRSEVVVTFLALLELMRLKQLVASQPEPFGEIEITAAPPSAPATDPSGENGAEPTLGEEIRSARTASALAVPSPHAPEPTVASPEIAHGDRRNP
jgi:segregation and condensation protein A